MPRKRGLYPDHCSTRPGAEAWARSKLGREGWRAAVGANRDLLLHVDGAAAVRSARADAVAVDDRLRAARRLVGEAAEIAAGWEIPPFEPVGPALGEAAAALDAAQLAAHRAVAGAIDADAALQFSDDAWKLDDVAPTPTRGRDSEREAEESARRRTFVRFATARGVRLEPAEWAALAVALGMEPPPGDEVRWEWLRNQWKKAMSRAR
jgi:hypothetical protein